jgi:hypothetical protein
LIEKIFTQSRGSALWSLAAIEHTPGHDRIEYTVWPTSRLGMSTK